MRVCSLASTLSGIAALGFAFVSTAAALPPVIEEESSSAVTRTTASLSARINPELENTFCLAFQYIDDASFRVEEYTGAATAFCEPEFLGSGEVSEPVATSLEGLSRNTVYHFRVLAENESGRSEGADRTFVTLPLAPTAETTSASMVSSNAATVAGMVNPGSEGVNSDATYFFEYGLTTGYGSETAPQDAGEGAVARAVTADLSSLEHGATYHFRIVASNANGTEAPQMIYGKDQAFSTHPTPPTVGAVAVSAIGPSTATLAATLEPSGLPTRYELRVGTATSELRTVSSGNTDAVVPLTFTITSLSPGTIYHYRLVAVNTNGGTESPEGLFSTTPALALPGSLEQPPTPPQLVTPTLPFPGEPSGMQPRKGNLLTTKEKLTRALRVCHKRPRKQRHNCERQARRRYRIRVKR
jgi:hypothetical protein